MRAASMSMAAAGPTISSAGFNEPWIIPDYQEASAAAGSAVDELVSNVLRFDPGAFFKQIFSGSGIQPVNRAPDGKNFYSFEATKLDGKKVKLASLLKGKKATLVVNVASK